MVCFTSIPQPYLTNCQPTFLSSR